MVEGLFHASVFQELFFRDFIIINIAHFHHHLYGAIGDFIIDKTHMHHPVVHYAAEPDHRGGADHVEDHFLCRAALHSRTAGDEFGAGDDFHRNVRLPGNRGPRIAGNARGGDSLHFFKDSTTNGVVPLAVIPITISF